MEVQKFSTPLGAEVRTIIGNDGELLFIAKDVAETLGYTWKGISGTIPHVPEEWRGVRSVQTPSGKQEMATLTEQGLYFFLGRSDKPSALPFQKWIAGEVIPAIRRTGSFSVSIPQTYSAALRLCADQAEKIEEQQKLLKAQQPAVDFVAAHVDTKMTKAVSDVGKVLGYGPKAFFALLSEQQVLFKRGGAWLPFQHHIDHGYFEVKTGTENGHAWFQTRFTAAGVQWIAGLVEKWSKATTEPTC